MDVPLSCPQCVVAYESKNFDELHHEKHIIHVLDIESVLKLQQVLEWKMNN